MTKILHIINSTSGGGAEKILERWIASPKRYDFDVLVLEKSKDNPGIISVNSSSAYSLRNIFSVLRFVSRYDLIHAHLFPSQFFVALCKFFFPKKIFVTTEHSTHNRRRKSTFLRYLDQFMYRQYNVITCVSEAVKHAMLSFLNKSRIVTIPNGVPLEEIRRVAPCTKSQLNCSEEAIVLCMASRFSEAKDQLTVIRAMPYLPDSVILILVGEGSLQTECEEAASNLGVSDRVHFLGYREEVQAIFKASDIIIQSSHWEGFGLTAIEAIACGKPVIVSDVEGVRDIVNCPEFIFKHKDEKDLVKKINAILSSSNLDELLTALQSKIEKYDFAKMIANYESLYDKLLDKEKRSTWVD